MHLKEQGIPPAEVRRIAPRGFVIGCSVHTAANIDARKAADLLIAGTVLPTASKQAPEYLNEDGLRRIVEAAATMYGESGWYLKARPQRPLHRRRACHPFPLALHLSNLLRLCPRPPHCWASPHRSTRC